MSTETELEEVITTRVENDSRFAKEQVTHINADHSVKDSCEVAEENGLLLQEQVVVCNSRKHSSRSGSVSSQNSSTPAGSHRQHGTPVPVKPCKSSQLFPDLKAVVFWRIRLWMIVLLLFVLVAVGISLSLVLCSVQHEDKDEKFDTQSLTVARYYTGSLRLVNQNFTADLLSLNSPQSQALSDYLKEKLSDLFRSSPALGRYFSEAGTSFRNGSVTASYWLKFLMPQEHAQLVRYTLSREMVYNVLRQNLYDQELQPWEPLYIDPTSVELEVGDSTVEDQ